MGSRTTENAAAPAAEEAVAAPQSAGFEPLRAGPEALTPRSVLLLQRAIGNAAVARVVAGQAAVARRIHGEDVVPDAIGADAWSDSEVRSIQTELKRIGLYGARVDGWRGPKTNAALSAAFDSEAWLSMQATEVHEKLKVAQRPGWAGGTQLNWSELFRDGVLDVTFGVGYFEGDPPAEETRQVAKGVIDALGERGYTEDAKKAAELLEKAGRPLSDAATGRFFIKENAFTYGPPAGTARPIHSIVRVVFNDVAGGGAKTAAAFKEGMTVGDAVWYSGHGRYGTGPDFDRNFIEFRLYDAEGNLLQTLDDYVALEAVLRKGGKDPWKVFEQRIADKTLQVDLSNAGNVRLVGAAHDNEFGAKLINWALEQSKTQVQTGAGGQLARGRRQGTPEVPRDGLLRLLDQLLRQGAAQHRGLQHQERRPAAHEPRHARRRRRRRVHGLPRQLRQPVIGREDAQRRQHRHAQAREPLHGRPLGVHRTQGQRRELRQRTRGFAWRALRYYDPVKRQTRPVGRENPAN